MTSDLDPAGRKQFQRAVDLFQENRLSLAEGICVELLARAPLDAELAFFAGLVANRMGRFDAAIERLTRCLRLDASRERARAALAWALLNKGGALQARALWREAAQAFLAALQVEPGLGAAHVNLAIVFAQAGEREAAAHHRQAARAARLDAVALARLGELYAIEGDTGAALELMDAAVSREPGNPEPRGMLSRQLLRTGRLERGWCEYLFRPTRGAEVFADIVAGRYPPLLPADVRGRDIVLAGEQGPADVLFFLRYARPLADAGARLHVRAERRLEPLVRRALPVAGWIEGDALPAGAIALWMGDLPAWVRPISGTDVCPSLAIAPLPERVGRMRALLEGLRPPVVALAWQAGLEQLKTPQGQQVLAKSIAPALLGGALAGTPATYVSIQRDPDPGSREALERALDKPVRDLSGANGDLEDMLALVSLFEGYVGVSSTNVHLMAAVGTTGCIVVPHPPEWRWQNEGRESPWFPGFSVHRQAPGGDWSRALEELRKGEMA